jgi:hypothetical protein
MDQKKKKLGLDSKFGTKPQLGFFCSIQVFFCTERSSDGVKRKKFELGLDSEFGTTPIWHIFCSIRVFLRVKALREAQMEQKNKIEPRPNSKFGVGPSIGLFLLHPSSSWYQKKFGWSKNLELGPRLIFFLFVPFEFFSMSKKTRMEKKRRAKLEVNSFFAIIKLSWCQESLVAAKNRAELLFFVATKFISMLK